MMAASRQALDLIHRYLDQVADESDIKALSDLLRKDENAAELFARLSQQEAMLIEISEEKTGDRAVTGGVPGGARARRRGPAVLALGASVIALSAAAAVLLIVAYHRPDSQRERALSPALAESAGKVELVGEGGALPAEPGVLLGPGQGLRTSPGARAKLRYPDGGAIELQGETKLHLEKGRLGKRLRLESGTVEAEVPLQPPDRPVVFTTPHAEARVLGTRLTLTVTEKSTQLEVREGKVRLRRLRDGKEVEVKGGYRALVTLVAALVVQPISALAAGGWPMAGANPERTSWVPEEVGGRMKPVWYRPIEPYISQNVQIVAADGKLFVSTARGLYALRAADGEIAWVYPTEMPLGHSPTYHKGSLYVGGFDRKLHCIDARIGKRRWTFDEARAGYRTSPLVVEGLVLLGNRDGSFYAVHADGTPREGTLAWKQQTGGPINYSAACKDGTVFFASMDMHCYALEARTGKVRWKTEKLHGAGFHSWWPVVWGKHGRVVFVTGHNYRNGQKPGSGSCSAPGFRRGGYYHDAEVKEVFAGLGERDFLGPTGTEPGDWVEGTFTVDMLKAAKYFGQKPWRRMTYVLDAATGRDWGADLDGDGKAEHAPFLWTGSKNGTPPPPMVSGFDNVLYRHNHYAMYRGARSHVSGWKFGTPFVSRITTDYGATDEPHIASGGGKYLYWTLCGDRESGWIDLSKPLPAGGRARSREASIFPGYHLYRVVPGYDEMWKGVGDQDGTGNRLWGYYGSLNGIYHNQTNDQNPFVPYRGHLYIHRSNSVICFGPEGGAAKKPLAKVQPPPPDTPVAIGEEELKKMLAGEIRKWLDAGHLHIGYFNASQFGHAPGRYRGLNNYFDNPAENIWVLMRALPHLPTAMRRRVREFIRREYEDFPPASASSIGWKDGASRDWFICPPEVEADRANFPATQRLDGYYWRRALPPLSFYVLWKYALLFGGAREIYGEVKGKLGAPPPQADWAKYPYELNAYIAGHMGYLGLEKLAGGPETAKVRQTLDQMLSWRAENFTKDTPFPSLGAYNKAKPSSHPNRLNVSRNFIYLTPELGDHLNKHALEKVRAAVEEYNRVAPYWFVSRYEGCLQEATVQNLHDYFALFQAKAWILKEPREELVKYLDVPGFMRGDCFYIHNLISAIEAAD